jgi:hypothetical protein
VLTLIIYNSDKPDKKILNFPRLCPCPNGCLWKGLKKSFSFHSVIWSVKSTSLLWHKYYEIFSVILLFGKVADIFVALLNFFTLLKVKLSKGKFKISKKSKINCLTYFCSLVFSTKFWCSSWIYLRGCNLAMKWNSFL